jgi:DNA polymerase-3 subunit epsilon
MSKAYLASFVSKVSKKPFLVLDTETTGTKRSDEICSVAIINSDGETLLDMLVKPTKPIPNAAFNTHKIRNEMVASAPPWTEVAPKVLEIVTGNPVVIYNAVFDVGMLQNSDRQSGKSFADWQDETAKEWLCAMRAFATFNNEWNSYRRSYAWKPLSVAAARFKVPVVNAHSALGDCLMTLGVVRGLVQHTASKGKAHGN